MALFSKPPVKKPAAARPASPPRATPARELAAQTARRKGANARPAAEPQGAGTLTGASLIDWSHAYASIEVANTNPGLCAVLENAALLYAGGQAEPARTTLEEGVQYDHDTKLSPLAWLALFDLLQRANQRAAFDQVALQYVVQFERSAPGWEEPAPSAVEQNPSAGGYLALAGKLTATGAQLLGLKRAIDKRIANARLDLSSVVSYDDAGACMLADLLAQARRHRLGLAIERPDKLALAVGTAIKKGRAGGQGAWLLALELLQWQHDQAAFDDRAVDYAVAFEMSPPSWEPPPRAAPKPEPPAAPPAKPLADADVMAFAGVMAGSNVPQVAAFADYALRRSVVAVDMTAVDRIDFVCAGAFLNAVSRTEAQRKTVQIVGASPIIRALLLLMGVSPRHFVKKSA